MSEDLIKEAAIQTGEVSFSIVEAPAPLRASPAKQKLPNPDYNERRTIPAIDERGSLLAHLRHDLNDFRNAVCSVGWKLPLIAPFAVNAPPVMSASTAAALKNAAAAVIAIAPTALL